MGRAKKVRGAVVGKLIRGRFFIDSHPTYWISCHLMFSASFRVVSPDCKFHGLSFFDPLNLNLHNALQTIRMMMNATTTANQAVRTSTKNAAAKNKKGKQQSPSPMSMLNLSFVYASCFIFGSVTATNSLR